MIDWRFAPFAELTPREVHDLYRARVAVFVVEQNCVFQDVDGADPVSWHLLGYSSPAAAGPRELIAYCRIIPPGIKFAEASIGRVVTTEAVRGTGMGRTLMREALNRSGELWPGKPIRIGAQQRLERFYHELGFATASAPYDEDGIPHVEMLLTARDRVGQA